MLMNVRLLLIPFAIFSSSAEIDSAELGYRTDGGDEKLPWYQLQPGEFPPEGSAHYISGELVAVDHLNRRGMIRPDRDDSQGVNRYDRPMPFTLLPYGSLSFHGAPAELRDVPLGTHLHGQFYLEEKSTTQDKQTFTRVLRFEDDFSFSARQNCLWRVDTISLNKGTLTAALASLPECKNDGDAREFEITAATRVWKGRAIGSLSDVAAGQLVLLNLTRCTLRGPGRCTDIWIDAESRQAAVAQQLEVHRQFQREHGLAGQVDEVDNRQGIVVVTLFSGFDASMRDDFRIGEGIAAVVAEDSLRTYDQESDAEHGPLLELRTTTPAPGDSGVRVKFKPAILLEGFRPKRIVRLFAGNWKVGSLPSEERLDE